MNDRQAIEQKHIQERKETATSKEEKALSEIEDAVGTMPEVIQRYADELREQGFRDDVIEGKLAEQRGKLIKQARLMGETVEGIAGAYSHDDDPTVKFEMNASHIEEGREFAAVGIDERNVRLQDAISGRNELLGQAILAHPRHYGVSPENVALIRKQIIPADIQQTTQQRNEMRDRIMKTAATLQRGIETLTRGTGS